MLEDILSLRCGGAAFLSVAMDFVADSRVNQHQNGSSLQLYALIRAFVDVSVVSFLIFHTFEFSIHRSLDWPPALPVTGLF